MLKLRVLTTVSVVALATAAGMTGAKANNLTMDFTIPATITIAVGSSDKEIANDQDNLGGSEAANTLNTIIAYPNNTLAAHDVDGGVDTILVDNVNSVFAVATGNEATNFIDFVTAENGGVLGDDGAATLGSNQVNVDHSVTALVDNSDIQISVLDLGAGSTARVDTNEMTATGFGNTADNTIAGDINPLQVSSEVGQATLTAGSPVLVAGATALVGNAQANIAVQSVPTLGSTISDSRIGLLAQVDDKTTAIVNVPLDVTDNVIAAEFTGNGATNAVDLGNDGAVTLVGTAGVANIQVNDGRYAIGAEVRNVTIEAGNTQNASPDEYISDLDGSALTLQGNEITAAATSNSAANSVGLDGISQNAPGTPTRLNTVDFGGADTSNVHGDLFIASGQYSSVSVNALVDGGSFNELVEDVTGSTLIADDNTVGAAATGSIVANDITVAGTTSFDSLVAINTVQYTEGLQTATDTSTIVFDVASTEGDAGSVTGSGLTVDGNSSYADAIGNSQSSTIAIDGTSVTGSSGLIINPILSNRALTTGGVSADISLLNAQVLDGGGAVADVDTSINVDVANMVFTVDSLSVSDNDIHGLAIGNLSTEASVIIDATTVGASVGVANVQTVEDGAQLRSTIDPTTGQPAFIDVDVGAGDGVNDVTVDASAVTVDGNTFDSRVWGNLADSTTNSIEISGVDVGDAQLYPSRGFVGRTGASIVSYTALDSGFALLNDQSVEDLEGSIVTATATGDLVNVTVGSLLASVTDSDISASKNSATTAATLNQATSEIGVEAITLNAGSGLVNVQTLADENNNGDSATIEVDQVDLDITVDVIAGDFAIENVNAVANGNSTLASGRINLATNSVSVKAQTQTIDGVIDNADPDGTKSVVLTGNTSNAQGEAMIINDQAFEELGAGGLTVTVTDNDITVDLSVDGNDIATSVAETNKNTINALAAGNDAANSISVDVGSFDLSTGDFNGVGPWTETNGPIATIASNQYGIGGIGNGGINTVVSDSTISVDVNSLDTTVGVGGSSLSADNNTVRGLSRSNNVSNALTASGTVVDNGALIEPSAAVSGQTLTLDGTTFAVGSRQTNSVDVSSAVTGSTVSVEAGSPFSDAINGSLSGSSLTANSNLIVSEARGNDAANSAALNFTLNGGQATVANLQLSAPAADDTLTYAANTTGTEISALSDADGGTSGSSLSASGNAVASLASASRATNTLTSAGTNVLFRNGDNVSTVDTSALNSVVSDASLLVLNAQSSVSSTVSTDTDLTLIGAVAAGNVDSGSVTANSNLILAQSNQVVATNSLNITSEANIASDSLVVAFAQFPGASVVSLQTLASTLTDASVEGALITAIADDTRTAGSVAMTAKDNQIIASAIGATANNTLRATAGASINAGGTFDQISGPAGDPTTTQAGFAVLNVQQGVAATSNASVSFVGIAAGGLEDYNFDSAVVADNLVQAEARGLVAANVLVLDAGSSADSTATISNLQSLTNSTSDAGVEGVAILTGNIDEGALDSSLLVSGNQVEALASGNKATNAMRITADASLQASDGASLDMDPSTSPQITVSGADYSILNNQSNLTGTITADVSIVGIGIDGLEETTGVNDSALNVEGNQVLASAVGNEVINSLELNTGTYQYPTAAIANMQTNTGTSVSASVDGAAIGIGGILTLNAASTNSSFTVRGNSIGASAVGNSAVNVLRTGD